MAFRIAQGFVEITSRLGNDTIRRDARRAGEQAGRSFGTGFESGSRRGLGRSRQQMSRTFQSTGRNAGQQAGRAFGRGFSSSSNEGLRRTQRQVNRNFSGMQRGASNTGRSMGRSIGRGSATASAGVAGLTSKFGGAKAGALGVAVAFAAVGKSVLGTSGQFEQSMNRVRAVSGATGEVFLKLREQAKHLGETTQFSATQAADGMSFLAMAGFRAKDILAAMPGVLNLAAAGQMDLARSADIASNILTGYGFKASKTGMIVDVLTKTFTSTNTNLTQLGEAFKYAGPVAHSAGVQFEEASAAIGLMGNAGIQSSMAGTALRGAITRLLSPTNKVQGVLEDLGVTVRTSSGKLLPLHSIIDQLGKSGATTGQLMTIFGQRAGPAMAALIDQGAPALVDLTKKLKHSGGSADKVAKIQMEGLKGSLTSAKSAIEGLVIAVGDLGVLKGATKVVDGFTAGVRGVTKAVGKAPETIGKLRDSLSGVFAKFRGEDAPQVAKAADKINGSFSGIRDSIGKVGASVKDRFSDLGGKILGIWSDVTDTFDRFKAEHGDKISEAFKTATDAVSGFGDMISGLIDLFDAVFNIVAGIVGTGLDIIRGLWGVFGDTLLNTLFNIGQGLLQILSGVFQTVRGVFQFFTGILTGDWGKAWDGIKNIFGGIWNVIVGIARTVWANIVGIFQLGAIAVGKFVGSLVNAVVAPFKWLYNVLVGHSIIPDMVNGITRWFTNVRDWVTSRVANMRDWVVTRIQALRDRAVARITSLRDRAVTLFSNVRDWVTSRAASLRDRVLGVFTSLKDRSISAFSKLVGGVKRVFGKLRSAASGPVNFVIDPVYRRGIKGVWDRIGPKIGLGTLPDLKRFKKGGITDVRGGAALSGYSRNDDQLAMVRSGEGVLVPEAVKSLGAGFVHMANRLKGRASEMLGIPGFGIGGIVGKFAGKAKSFFVGGFVKALKAAMGPIVGQVTSRFGADSTFRGMPGKAVQHIAAKTIGFLSRFAGQLEGGDGRKVVEVAEKYIGLSGNPNRFTRRMGMNGLPWCFAAGTLIRTPDGYLPIEDVEPGTAVVTPTGAVIATTQLLTREKELLKLSALGVPDTLVTADHPYWARLRTSSSGNRRRLAAPDWVKASDLRRGDMIALPLLEPAEEALDTAVAYLLGMYVADGHRLHRERAVQISDSDSDVERIVAACKAAGYGAPRVTRGRTCAQVTVYDRSAYDLCAQAGDLAHGKRVPASVLRADRAARRAFLDGYLAGDGNLNARGEWQCTTVSRELAVGLAEVLRSLGHFPTCRVRRGPGPMVIEGRTVQCREAYTVAFRPEHDASRAQFYVEDGMLWVPVRSVTETGRTETVYDLTVPGEHAFIADGAAVHNCGMFVDGVFDEAKASKALRGVANPAAVWSYRALPKVSQSQKKAGDLGLYRGDAGHINIYTGKGSTTIGGNESNSVRRQSGYIGTASSIRRPRFAGGGIVDNPAAAAFLWQDRADSDWFHTAARTRHLRDALDMSGVSGPPWVRDMGGMLPPGGIAVNASGQAEVVQTLDQLRAIVEAAKGQHITYVFEAGSIVLDASKIKDLQDLIAMIEKLRSTARQFGAKVR